MLLNMMLMLMMIRMVTTMMMMMITMMIVKMTLWRDYIPSQYYMSIHVLVQTALLSLNPDSMYTGDSKYMELIFDDTGLCNPLFT